MMDDLISREDACDVLAEHKYLIQYCLGDENELCKVVDNCISKIKQLPSAERTGEWITDYCGTTRCSECNTLAPCYEDRTTWFSKLCPECGARMKGEEYA